MTCRAQTNADCLGRGCWAPEVPQLDDKPSVNHWLLEKGTILCEIERLPQRSVHRRLLKTGLACAAGLPEPVPGPVPRVITYQRKRANRRIVNEEGFVRMLREFGEVRNFALAALGTCY